MKKIYLIISILFVLLIINFNFINSKGVGGIKYKIYYDKPNYIKIYRNGQKTKISSKKIQFIEIINKYDVGQEIQFFDGKNWTKNNKKISNIYGIKVINSRYFDKKYKICYRTYNEKNKWLNWTCSDFNDTISGNSKYPIKAVQFKVLYLNSNEYDYLDDYFDNKNKINYGFYED